MTHHGDHALDAAGISIQWGAWAGVGLAAQRSTVLARIERSGMGVLKPAHGLSLLQALLSTTAPEQVQNLVLIIH